MPVQAIITPIVKRRALRMIYETITDFHAFPCYFALGVN